AGPGGAEAEAAADAPDLDEAVLCALVLEASSGSPGAMSAVAQRLVAEERPPHGRADSVGADDDVCDDGLTTVQERLAVLGRADARPPEEQVLGGHRLEHRPLQLTTQDPVRLPAQRVVVDERQQVAARITDLGPPHPSPAGCDTLAEPERAQRRDCVCRDAQPQSRLVELRHLLDYGRL